MSEEVVECPRHGGPWGQDETCAYCTHHDGTARPVGSPGPLGPGAEQPRDLAQRALERLMAETAEDADRLASMLAELRQREDEGGEEHADAAWREFRETNIYGTTHAHLFRYTLAGFGPTIYLEVEADQAGWRDYRVSEVRLVGNRGHGDLVTPVKEGQGLWSLAEQLLAEEA